MFIVKKFMPTWINSILNPEARAAFRHVVMAEANLSFSLSHTHTHTHTYTRGCWRGMRYSRRANADGWEYGKPGGLPICATSKWPCREDFAPSGFSDFTRSFRVYRRNCIIKLLFLLPLSFFSLSWTIQIILIAMRWENRKLGTYGVNNRRQNASRDILLD